MLILVNMQCFVLIGDKNKSFEFIKAYEKANSILPYNIYVYSDKLKVAQVRDIKKKLGFKNGQDSKRLFIIENGATMEAQNALLKTLEELAAGDIFFLLCLSKEEYLPTILSRAFHKSFIKEVASRDEGLEKKISEAFDNISVNSRLKLSDSLFSTKDEENTYEKLVLSLRSILLSPVNSFNNETMKKWSNILYNLNKNYGIIKNNNVNKRFMLEKILLENIS